MEPPASGSALPGLLSILVLVFANAFFVAAEFALVGARRTRLEEMIRAGDRKALLARNAIQSLRRYISATQIGITMCSLGLGWIGEPTLARSIESFFTWLPETVRTIATHSVAVTIAFALITILHIVLGELVPKAVAIAFPEHSSRWLTPPLMGFAWVMRGPAWLLNGMATKLVKLIGIKDSGEHGRLHSPEEIRILVEQSEEGGSLDRQDARLLEGVFEFSEKTAEDVMTPRTEIVALEASLTIAQAAAIVAEAARSRYPVHHDSLDEIIGIVHAKDILRTLLAQADASVGSIVRPPLFVPGTKEVEDVLVEMKRLKVHMAIVLDEYGGTAGLVTMEDLLEEIVGPIFDEHDRPETTAPPAGAAAEVDGSITISEFNTEYGTTIDDADYTTLGGFLFGQLGRLPQVGDRVSAASKVFEIAAMDGRRVKSVRLVAETHDGTAKDGKTARRTDDGTAAGRQDGR